MEVTKPSKEGVLKVVGEPVAWLYKDDHLSGDTLSFMRLTHYYKTPSGKYITGVPLYTEAQALTLCKESERFFLDHGLWHDKVTGQHIYTQDQYDNLRRDAFHHGYSSALTKPSKEGVLKVVGEPVALEWKISYITGGYTRHLCTDMVDTQELDDQYKVEGIITPLYTEAQALAMYAAGAEDMKERAVAAANKEVSDWEILRDISVARKESALIESTNILAINRLIAAIRALPITTTNTKGEQG